MLYSIDFNLTDLISYAVLFTVQFVICKFSVQVEILSYFLFRGCFFETGLLNTNLQI